jgi:hypothetical protein
LLLKIANIFLLETLYRYKALSSYLNGQALVIYTRSFFFGFCVGWSEQSERNAEVARSKMNEKFAKQIKVNDCVV